MTGPGGDPLIGSDIGRYRISRVLGEGGMGKVYLAVQPEIGSRVAIKVLSEQCSGNAELVERFFSEARAVNLVHHEHIVSVLDLARFPDGRPFIVMEFIEGQTLAQILRRGRVPMGGVVQVMGEVLGALAAAHAIGIVHRDMKPDNVLVTVEGHAKVLDFGIAKLAPGLSSNSPRTQTGAMMGTPAYMAPEQISGAGNVDPRSDVYAAGVVLFEAMTGQPPFQATQLFDLMRAHLETVPPAPRALRPELPPALESVILTALAKDPAQRFQSAGAMAQALATAAASLPAEEWRPLSTRGGAMAPRVSLPGHSPDAYQSTAVAPPPAPTVVQRRWLRIAVPIALAAVAVGVTVLVMSSNGSAPAAGSAAVAAGSAPAAAVGSAPVAEVAAAETTPPPASGPPAAVPAPTRSPSPAPAPASPPPPAAPHPAAPPPAAPQPDDPATRGIRADAAKHGVIIGKHVDLGPGVIIGSNTPAAAPAASSPTSLAKPADYDPRHFDPVGYLPRAQALARQLAPDAQLSEFEFDPVMSDGHLDLTKPGRDREYDFRSPSRSAHPADVPRNVPVDRACMIHVEVGATEVTATLRTSDTCDAKLPRVPHCHLASVWKQALAAGTPADFAARIGWMSDGTWFFDTDLDGSGQTGGVSTFADRCP